MTITEFLLARIAEDEANIKGDWAAGDGGLHIIGSAMHGRMLAECAAKRAIVTEHECLEAGIEVWLDEPDLPNWEGFNSCANLNSDTHYREHTYVRRQREKRCNPSLTSANAQEPRMNRRDSPKPREPQRLGASALPGGAMTWENYPVHSDRIPPYEAISMDFEPAWITTECATCGKTRHALGVYCYPIAFWLTAALFAAAIVAIIVATIVRICT